jgi:ubiquinone biosynthesis protein UbiJ
MDFAQLFAAGLETAINKTLQLDTETLNKFERLESNIIAIDIKGVNQSVYLFPSADGFMVLMDFDGEADVVIRGTPIALVKMALAKDQRDELFSGEVEIIGDTRVANQFSKLLSQLDIDWEEILSKGIGDIAAHKVGNIFRDMNAWFMRATDSAHLDAGEYLQEEIHLSPSNPELRKFINNVDNLREGIDRLEAKLKHLKNAN